MTPQQAQDLISTLKAIVGKTPLYKVSGTDIGVTATTYASGDVVGGLFELKNIVRGNNGTGIIQSLLIKDLSKSNVDLDVVLFDSEPVNSTFTDNSAADVNDSDIDKIVGIINVETVDYSDFSDNSVALITNQAMPYQNNASNNSVWLLFIVRATITFEANCLSATIGVLQDA